MFKLLRHFSLCSAIVTAIVTALLVYGYRTIEMRQLIEATERDNVTLSRVLANTLGAEIEAYVNKVQSINPDILREMPDTRDWHQKLRRVTSGLPVLKVKLYTVGGKTVFSSEAAQIGKGPSSGVEFDLVLNSSKTHSILEFRKKFMAFDGELPDRYVVGTYLPVFDPARRVVAVIELYTDVTQQVDRVGKLIWLTCAVISAAFGFLYLALLLVVRRADVIIRRQYDELATFNSTLEARVAERTEIAEGSVRSAQLANENLRSEIEDRKRTEQAMLRKNQRLVVLLDSLGLLMRGDGLRAATFADACANLTEAAAVTMGIGRVSIWLFDSKHAHIDCADLFEASERRHSSGQQVEVSAYPRYFNTLSLGREIVADDVTSHPSTAEFFDDYLRPRKIASMLDVPILRDGVVEGIVSCEHVGDPICWAPEQRIYALALASLVSLLLEQNERRRAEQELRQMNSTLEAATAAKSQFLANMSHEIRTPMNGVFGMTDLLLRTNLSDHQQRLVSTISLSAKSLLTVINDILDLSRIEAGKLDIDLADFDLRECVEGAMDLFAESAGRKGLDLCHFTEPQIPERLVGDAGRLHQVLVNLVGNAIKFTSTGEVVLRVTTGGPSATGHTIRFEVSDTGIGIAPAVIEKLCAPFVQADTSITRRFGGTGLGLSISRHLIGLMGGTFQITSNLGQGTNIRVEIPMKMVASTRLHRADGLAGRRILVIEKSATAADILCRYLSASGAEAVLAKEITTGLEHAVVAQEQNVPFDAMIADASVVDGSGRDILELVSGSSNFGSPNILLTKPLTWSGDSEALALRGACAVLNKPVRDRQMLAALSAAFNRGAELVTKVTADVATTLALPNAVQLGLSVLLAEDNPVNVEVAQEYLSSLGCRVTIAETGREAVTMWEKGRFDIVLMDCHMPEMDGLTATQLIRMRERELDLGRIPIVAVTANAYEEDRRRGLAAGMDDLLVKPFSEEQLGQILQQWTKSSAGRPSVATVAHVAAPTIVPTPPLVKVDANRPLQHQRRGTGVKKQAKRRGG